MQSTSKKIRCSRIDSKIVSIAQRKVGTVLTHRIPQSALSSPFLVSLALCTWALISLGTWYWYPSAFSTSIPLPLVLACPESNPSTPQLIPPVTRPPCNQPFQQPACPAIHSSRSPTTTQPAARPPTAAQISRSSFAPQPAPPRSSSAQRLVNSTKDPTGVVRSRLSWVSVNVGQTGYLCTSSFSVVLLI